MRKLAVLVLMLMSLVGCMRPSVQKDGGLLIELEFSDKNLTEEQKEKALDIIRRRATAMCKAEPEITRSGNMIHVALPQETDTALYTRIMLSIGDFEIHKAYDLPYMLNDLKKINEQVLGYDSSSKDSLSLFSLFKLNKEDMKSPAMEPILGFALTADTAAVNELLAQAAARKLLPSQISFRWDLLESFDHYALYAVEKSSVVSREMLDNSRSNSEPSVYLKKEYADQWKEFTGQNKGNFVAISLDKKVFRYPKIEGAVNEGQIYRYSGGISFINDMIWSFVLPVINTDLLEAKFEVKKVTQVAP